MRPITRRQQAVLDFVRNYLANKGFPPTLREIGEAQGLTNISAVRGHLAALEKKGYLAKEPDKARSIRLVNGPSLLSRFKRKLHEFARTDEGVLHRVVYGLALATHERRPLLTDAIRGRIEAALDKRCREHGWQFLRRQIEADHIAVVVRVWPNHSPEAVITRIRHCCMSVIRRGNKGLLPRRIWAKGYVVTTDAEALDGMVEQFLDDLPPQSPRLSATEN